MLAATWLALLALGCGGGPPVQGPEPESTASVVRLVDRDRLYLVEAWGAAPNDTVLTVAVGEPRVVILRHGPPDNAVFAELELPADVFDADGMDSVRVTLTPIPGLFGVTITSEAPVRPTAALTFKYAMHFVAPGGATERYGTNVAFETALFVGRLQQDGRVAVLNSTRPASDNLRALLPATGTYVVAALR